ncbi:hypothetical protein N7486_009122 [Penicillium sp. IBT 16267x]|nr:hypothetical protein N7486_009122 [Penicillium sp. IBT 16267x]
MRIALPYNVFSKLNLTSTSVLRSTGATIYGSTGSYLTSSQHAGKMVELRGRYRTPVTLYLIKWEGLGHEHDEWVRERDAVGAEELIQEFENDRLAQFQAVGDQDR